LWNLGDTPGKAYTNVCNSFIKNWEHIHGFVPKNDFPIIYYKPKYHANVEGLIDLSSISVRYDLPRLVVAIKNLIKEQYATLKFKVVVSTYHNVLEGFGFDVVSITSLEQYVDLINSCKVFISTYSGQHMLGGSIRHINMEFEQHCFIPEHDHGVPDCGDSTLYDKVMKTKLFILPAVTYHRI